MSDVRLHDQGSVGFLPRTEAAEEWIAENLQAEFYPRPGLILVGRSPPRGRLGQCHDRRRIGCGKPIGSLYRRFPAEGRLVPLFSFLTATSGVDCHATKNAIRSWCPRRSGGSS